MQIVIKIKAEKTPETTAELVETTQFVTQCLDATVYKLAFKIDEARQRLMFLLDYASMPSEYNIINFSNLF